MKFFLLTSKSRTNFRPLLYTHTKRIWQTNPLKNPRIDSLDDFFTFMIPLNNLVLILFIKKSS
ncbi:hypothetical protein EFM62_02285 [Enterococcus faecium]|nr:hypothetical protein [Enterococcus faecium]